MKITTVRAYPLTALFEAIYGSADRVPPHMSRPASHFRRFRRRGQHATLVRIETDEGIVGVGEAFGLPLPTVTASILEQLIAPELVGRDPMDAEAIWDDFYAYFRALGQTRGPMMEALSAADIALWDIKAKALGHPLWRVLEGERDWIAAYASPIPFYEDPQQTLEHARAYREEGFNGVKVKVGRGVDVDVQHIAAAREGAGKQALLMLDANSGYDVPTAIALARELVPYDIAWFEEPVPPDDVPGMVEVRKASPVPIAAGENEFTPFAVDQMLRAGAVDIIQPNITRIGGVTGARRVAELAQTHGVRFAPHGVGSWVGISAMLHVCSVAPTFFVYEANRLQNPLRDGTLCSSFRFEHGGFVLPPNPGLGVQVDWEATQTYLERLAV